MRWKFCTFIRVSCSLTQPQGARFKIDAQRGVDPQRSTPSQPVGFPEFDFDKELSAPSGFANRGDPPTDGLRVVIPKGSRWRYQEGTRGYISGYEGDGVAWYVAARRARIVTHDWDLSLELGGKVSHLYSPGENFGRDNPGAPVHHALVWQAPSTRSGCSCPRQVVKVGSVKSCVILTGFRNGPFVNGLETRLGELTRRFALRLVCALALVFSLMVFVIMCPNLDVGLNGCRSLKERV